MKKLLLFLFIFSFLLSKAQVYQAMPQQGYGPVKRMLFDSVVTLPLGISRLRNITGGRDTGQIRYNISDSSLYVYSGYNWLKSGGVKSVALTMPSAFSVTGSPVTGTGTLYVAGAGTNQQYIDGTGALINFPAIGTGGNSVSLFLNGSVTSNVSTYYQLGQNANTGTAADFTLNHDGLIAQFLTDTLVPNRTSITAGSWGLEMWFSVSSNGGNAKFYVDLVKYSGGAFTTIATSSATPEAMTNGTITDLYNTNITVPATTLATTDRIGIRVYIVDNSGGRTVTLYTQNSTLSQVITNFVAGNMSVGNGYKVAINQTTNIKSLTGGYGITLDSATSNTVNFKADTSTLFPAVRSTITTSSNAKYDSAYKTAYALWGGDTSVMIVGGVIRPTISLSTDSVTWAWINDANHIYKNVTPTISANGGSGIITINYPHGYRVISSSVTVDEQLAKYGIQIGASVDTSFASVYFNVINNWGGYVYFDGTNYTSSGEWSQNNPSVTYNSSTGLVTLTVSNTIKTNIVQDYYNIAVVPTKSSSNWVYDIFSAGSTTLPFYQVDYLGNTITGTPTLYSGFTWRGPTYFKPVNTQYMGSSNAWLKTIFNSLSNIWVIIIIKKSI